jgi:hypothetical protein
MSQLAHAQPVVAPLGQCPPRDGSGEVIHHGAPSQVEPAPPVRVDDEARYLKGPHWIKDEVCPCEDCGELAMEHEGLFGEKHPRVPSQLASAALYGQRYEVHGKGIAAISFPPRRSCGDPP